MQELMLFSNLISCNLPKLCCLLVGPGENRAVEFPSPYADELTSVQEGIPHWFHTKMSQVAWGIIRDECPFPNEGSFICTSRQMYFFTIWQGCFGKQENANNKKCLKTMTTKSVIMYVLLESYCHTGPIAK